MIVESWLARAAAAAPRRRAIEDGERACSYAELHAAACAGAAELQKRGVEAGQSVAIALRPGVPFAIALHACWLAEATAIPVDTRLAGREREAIVAGASLVLDQPLVDPPTGEAACAGLSATAAQGAVHDLDAVAAVIHTSGTTSQPKRVELTFGNLLWSALGSAVALGCDPQERWLCTLPLSHVGGLSILVRSAIYATTAVVHERFETQRALAALTHGEITLISVVATTLERLLDAGLERAPALRCALAGGGLVPPALLARAAAAGIPVSQTYGLTEACSQVSTVPLAALRAPAAGDAVKLDASVARDATELDASVARDAAALGAGRPLFCTRVRIAASSFAIDADAGETGEILVAGPTVAPGARSADGWLHTGDLGMLDAQGNLHVTGRRADTIVSGGENVAPAEVEAALEAHPQVAEAAVVGRNDPHWGEAVTAIVVPRAGATPTPEDLRAHCARMLAAYKVPKQVLLVAGPLPRTRSGKLLRRRLA